MPSLNVGTLSALLELDDGPFQRGMSGVSTSFHRASEATRGHERELKQLGLAAGVMGGAMVVGFGAAAGAAMGFDKEISNVRAVSGATAEEMGRLRAAALEAGKATAFSASEAAKAEAELVKAGISTADVLGGALRGSLDLAAAGQLDLAQAAGISAQAMNIFKLRGGDVAHIADVLAAGANKSAADVGQLGDALKQGGLVAAQTGLSLEETVAALSAFADKALVGSDAGTSLKTMLQSLTPQSEEAAGLMRELGFNAYDAQGNFIGLGKLAAELQSSLGGLTVEQRNSAMATLFGSDAVRAANILYEQGEQGIRDYIGAVDDQGAAQRMASEQMDNLAGDLEGLKGSIETALIQGGSQATGALRFLTQGATEAVNAFGEMPASVQGAAVALTGVGGVSLLTLGAIGSMIPKIREARAALEGLGVAGTRLNGLIGTLGRMGGVVGGAIATVTALEAMNNWLDSIENKDANVPKLTSALIDLAKGAADLDDVLEFTGHDLEALDAAFAGMVNAGTPDLAARALRAYAEAQIEAQRAAGGTPETLKQAMSGFPQYQAALEQQAAATAIAGEATKEAAGEAGQLAGATGKAADGLGGMTSEADITREAMEKLNDAVNDMRDTLLGVEAADIAFERAKDRQQDAIGRVYDAQINLNNVIDVFGEKSGEAGAAAEDLNRAQLDLRDANLDLIRAGDDLKTSLDAQYAATAGNSVEAGILRDRLEELKARFPELTDLLDPYIARLNAIPTDVRTNIFIDGEAALQTLTDIERRLAAFGIDPAAANAYALPPGVQGPLMPLPQGPLQGTAAGAGAAGKSLIPRSGGSALVSGERMMQGAPSTIDMDRLAVAVAEALGPHLGSGDGGVHIDARGIQDPDALVDYAFRARAWHLSKTGL